MSARQGTNLVAAALLLLALSAAILFAPGEAARGAKAGLPLPGAKAQLQTALDRIVSEPGGPPAVSVLIQRGAKREYFGRGFADIARGRRPRPQLPMRIASVAKAFSGAVALKLVAQGKLKLDDTIGKWLPGLMPRANRVTLRQALNHTGGLPDYIRDPGFLRVFLRDPTRAMTPRQLISFVRNKPLRHRPGTKYEYSDTDNIIVALMAEAATGKRYERLLRELVTDPLKLRSTTLPRSLAIKEPFLHGYEVPNPEASEGEGGEDAEPEDVSRMINPTLAGASGGIVSSVLDLNRFFRAYVGGRLFRYQRFRPGGESSPPGPGNNSAGLGLFRYRTRCGTVYGHTGSFPGYRMFAAASRDGTRSVVFAVNAQIVPGQGSQHISNLIRQAQTFAVCHALR